MISSEMTLKLVQIRYDTTQRCLVDSEIERCPLATNLLRTSVALLMTRSCTYYAATTGDTLLDEAAIPTPQGARDAPQSAGPADERSRPTRQFHDADYSRLAGHVYPQRASSVSEDIEEVMPCIATPLFLLCDIAKRVDGRVGCLLFLFLLLLPLSRRNCFSLCDSASPSRALN